jgi:hypothetical protein
MSQFPFEEKVLRYLTRAPLSGERVNRPADSGTMEELRACGEKIS